MAQLEPDEYLCVVRDENGEKRTEIHFVSFFAERPSKHFFSHVRTEPPLLGY